ncbi:Bug family tripartite tricarboxylate transporter substrate binding protein [Rhodoligotrophos ferricapiens]|uniref:Bug family tripartite tricarboxylate transporter substrate binding protein n=1 Tax=Rhodoligotrophos ferricapiens TaxID=3069264 RepID=UPI00315DAB30
MKRLLAAALAVLFGCATYQAQGASAELEKLKPADFPDKPVELVVVYPAGGGMDYTARLLAKYMEKHFDNKVVVQNRTGGAGVIGHTYLATQAKPDGYTLGVVANTMWADSLFRANNRWTYKDFEPIAFINYDPLTWAVATDGPFKDKSLKQIIEAAKASPGTVRVAVLGGNTSEFLAEHVEVVSGAKFTKVPFQGGAPGITAALGGHVEIGGAFTAEYRGHIDAGKMRAVGVAGAQRSPTLPDTETFNEALGSNEIIWQAWRYVTVPKGIPEDRKAFLIAWVNAALDDPELQAEYRKTGALMDRNLKDPAQISAEIDKLFALESEFYKKSGRLK